MNWSRQLEEAAACFGTPLYVFSWDRCLAAINELEDIRTHIPVRHWLSMKTQPIRRLIRKWYDRGDGVEVVSEFELKSALREGFAPERILVNGVAKHSWLGTFAATGLRVHFDSLREVTELGVVAGLRQWHVGVRCCVKGQTDPDDESYVGQFGMSQQEVIRAVSELAKLRLQVESVHFHLRSNISEIAAYQTALSDLADICDKAKIYPRYVDCGGGLECPGDQWPRETTCFGSQELSAALDDGISRIRSAEEVWLENGRFVTGRSGALVLKVLDIKDRCESRYIICDGGRTNHALVSDWERHKLEVIPERNGPPCHTTVCGPTCMAFDRLCRADLPMDIMVGDLVVWHNAGAYHIPWETRFSHGLAAVAWIENGEMTLARKRETVDGWWNLWC